MAWWSAYIQKAATGNLSVIAIRENKGGNVIPIS